MIAEKDYQKRKRVLKAAIRDCEDTLMSNLTNEEVSIFDKWLYGDIEVKQLRKNQTNVSKFILDYIEKKIK